MSPSTVPVAQSPSRPLPRLVAVAIVAGLLPLALGPRATAQEAPPPPPAGPEEPPPGGAPERPPMTPERRAWREAMWPAPTAEDWAKPVLLTFQRTWEDAVAVAKEEGRPILVCINMDGEIASEHYAGVRYRQPDIAALYEPYVLVIASVYRHNPRDHDDEGRRILCPRFGSVTCGEHIAIEPGIFEKFCDGKRIAPRHILVEIDGKETFDVFYRNDTASVFEDIRKAVADRAPLPPRPVRGDRPVLERVASREVRDRSAVEAAYAKGSPEERKALLDAAIKHADAAQLDLLRLAVFGLDPDLSRSARQALAKTDAPAATELVAEALRVPMDAAERDALIATLRRLGDASPLARWLAVVHQGLAARSGAVDAKGWSGPAADGSLPSATLWPDWAGLESRLEFETRAARSNPADAAALLNLAETTLALAVEAPRAYAAEAWRAKLTSRHLFDDARRTALEAERRGAAGWRVNAVVALAAYHAGDIEEAYARAAAAVKDAPAGDTTWASMAVMTVFAEGRFKQIKKAVKEKPDFPPEWLADVNAAYAVLLRHPLGTEGQVIWHYDLLDWLGATDQATAVLREGLRRFGDSPVLHERLREYLLRKRGPRGLEAYYDGLLKEQGARASLAWYAGAACAAAAEQARRAGRADAALGAYGRAIALFERAAAADPALKDASDHGVALALAARARVELEQGKDEAAAADVAAALARRPASAGTADGMSQKPGDTAHAVLARLKAAGRADLAAAIEAALAKVDPELLIPD